MRRRNVETTLGTYAIHAQPFYAKTYGYAPGDLPQSYRIYKQSLTLPLYPQMSTGDVEQVVVALVDSLQEIA